MPAQRNGHPSATAGRETVSSAPPLDGLISERREGWTLPQPFFNDPAIYRADLDRVWRTGWLFAGHSCEIGQAGDYFLVEVDVDSIIVIRDEKGAVHALHNLCRHRGSQLCDEPCGHVTKLVCPYHQWAYGLDGRLLAWRGMQPELKKDDFPLQRVHVREVEGLIFINLAAEPMPFDLAAGCLAPLLKPQGLRRAKVAKAVDYLVKANWKVVWENNRECYHCNVCHPQYIKANFDHYNSDDTAPLIRAQMETAIARGEAKWAEEGLAPTHRETGMTKFPDAERGIWFSANRTPLVDGWVSETMDGRQAAPLMGDYADADVGTLRMRSLPNFWNHSSCDHAVSTRLLPAGPQLTAIRVWWLVDEKAVEGRDYDLAKLMPFWQLTSEQDWVICERQQKGINSNAYLPGPYSTFKEYNVEGFVRWYLDVMKRGA
ncbi:MAG TPA: aromatic ring-hydroxylating dioxygenase subunit alpha [Candidatus Limnocylindria bacterium]|nr:aromatic ring-hydroxylating dioxygenase subunit alpha [Candidatus Limnocylindria bacterium]